MPADALDYQLIGDDPQGVAVKLDPEDGGVLGPIGGILGGRR